MLGTLPTSSASTPRGITGPSTSQSPYLTAERPNVHLVSLLTAGDTVAGATLADGQPWRFAGTPDGIGAYDNGDGTATVVVNHEFRADDGGPHDTGAPSGSFVDRLTISKASLAVVSAQELGQRVFSYDAVTGSFVEQPTVLSRLCSADLPAQSAWFDPTTGLGTTARIFLNGEENGPEGRALGWIVDGADAGSVYELPALGNFSIENLLASPNAGERTVVIGNEDATGGQLYVYAGTKQAEGSDIERAGLTNGQLYGVKADFLNEASSGQSLSGSFQLAPLGDVTDENGAQLQAQSDAGGVTGWLRPEDGAWDTVNPNRYYFATTNSITGPSRLWALDFYDAKHPEYGGQYRALLDGSEGQKMLDNITVAADGTLVLQEDVGNNPRAGKVWSFDPKTDQLTELARHDVSRFGDETTPPVAPFTQDEESSGVLDVTSLFGDGAGRQVFLLDTQAHYDFGEPGSADRQRIVEGGQLQLMYVDPPQTQVTADRLRVATFNASLNRPAQGGLVADLATPDDPQARTDAEIIQRVDPDILLVNEFDYAPDGVAASLFQQNYLGVSQNTLGLPSGPAFATEFPARFTAPSNTGVASGFDLNNDGQVVQTPGAPGYGDDSLGFGQFPGQYGIAVFSKPPILADQVRTFQTFLWKDMPGALLPDDSGTPEPGDYYSEGELSVFRLASKSFWDVPVQVGGDVVHLIAGHPTPPTFDGSEDRNGLRNHDEIRFLSDYVTPGQGDYIYDDKGRHGGLAPGSRFVVMGDMNADPNDGDSVGGAASQLLGSSAINAGVTPFSAGGAEQSFRQGGANIGQVGNPAFDTADFADAAPGNLRVDYVLPSADGFRPLDAGVFWPQESDPTFPLVGAYDPALPGGFPSSDHRLTYADLQLVGANQG